MAAGNSASSTPVYPAADAVPGTISIAASTQNDTLATFSNYRSWVDVAAPGQGVLSTVPGGGYATWSGTSMATPFVAGEAALVRSVFSTWDTGKVAQRITSRCSKIAGPVGLRIDAAAVLGR